MKRKVFSLYAIWTPVMYTVNVNPNNGNDSTTTLSVEYGTVLNLSTPEYDGYRFQGWYNGSTKFDARTEGVKESMTLTAKWEKVSSFNVNFCYIDSSTSSVVKDVAYGKTVTAPIEVKIDGLVFKGWYKGDSTFDPFIFSGEAFDFSQKITGDIYLYAKYIVTEETLKGTWTLSYYTVDILEENGKKIIKASSSKNDMGEVGTWEYDASSGTFEAVFSGQYAVYMTGMYPAFASSNPGQNGESLINPDYGVTKYYEYRSDRTPIAGSVKSRWTIDEGQWTGAVTFSEAEADEVLSIYSNTAKTSLVSKTEIATPYQYVDMNGQAGALFVDNTNGLGFDSAGAAFSTSLSFASGVDSIYLFGIVMETEKPMTRVN